MRTRVICITGVTAFYLLLSCGAAGTMDGDPPVRSAIDTPERFELPMGASWDDTCKNPLIDPMDGSELILVESRDGFGNYRPNQLKYGMTRGELLRINCRTGAVVGIVKGK